MANIAHTTPSRFRNNHAQAFGFPDLKKIAAARMPAGASLIIDTTADFAEEVAVFSADTVCPLSGMPHPRQVAAFYREGVGRAVRVDIGDGTGAGDRSQLVASVADALTLVLPVVEAAVSAR